MSDITYHEAKYLKHVGQENDVKVSLKIIEKQPFLYIRDQEFSAFARALVCLQHIVENEMSQTRGK